MAIKSGIGRLKLTIPIRDYVQQHLAANGFRQQNISFRHAAKVEYPPWHYRDPLSMLIAAQAIEEKMIIISAGPIFDSYNVQRIW